MSRVASSLRAIAERPASWIAAGLFLPVIVVASALSRRTHTTGSPRLLWGPTPIISLKYWSAAMRNRGYESQTLVNGVYSINSRGDFDRTYQDFVPWLPGGALIRPYLAYIWALSRFDVFVSFFDGGLLASTAVASAEWPLLRLARKRVILMPYGSDIAVPEHLGPFRDVVLQDYPHLAERAAATRARVDRLSRWGDLVIRNIQPGYLPRHDVLWPTCLAIDTDQWVPTTEPSTNDGKVGCVRIAHSANHRRIKGTEAVIAAVDELRGEGLDVKLELLERVPNEVVRRTLADADIVVEQLICGYALAAIEGMAVGRPVVSNLSWLPDEIRTTSALRECPIVDASVETLVDRLRDLVTDPERRRALGRRSRDYVLRWHSYDAVGRQWSDLVEGVWSGDGRSPGAEDLA
jgi:Glycosyl transferases group 1